MKKIAALAIMTFLIAGLLYAALPLNMPAANAALPDPVAIKDEHVAPKKVPLQDPQDSNPDPVPYYSVGAVVRWVTANLYTGYYYSRLFKLAAIGTYGEIWVASYPNGTYNLEWPSGDPRDKPQIFDNETAFLLNEFDTVLYPTDTHYFGAPAVRDGNGAHYGTPGRFNGTTRVAILVENIIDENYYNSSYPYYVAGFFDSGIAYYTGRNVITIDSYRWERRLGPLGTIWLDSITVNRPFVYDSTIAHEFQHLIHNDWNPSDPAFMNEGCAMYAEYLCGFGIDPSYINSFLYTPDNSLTDWSDQGDINILADYGAGAMWVIYLNDHYGGSATISYFVQNGIPGIDGINAALAHFGYKQKFDDVFHDWRLANLIHTDFPGCTKYNYKSLNLSDPIYIPAFTHSITGLPVPQTKGTDFGTTKTILGYDTEVSEIGPYGTDYINFTNWKLPGFIYFQGDKYATFGWTQSNGVWWSGYGNLMDAQLISQAVSVTSSNSMLTLVTKYGMETTYDFGFVQVSTDNGATWTSLSNSYTTSIYNTDVQAIINNLPGLTDYNPDWPAYTTMTFDLSPYIGKTVLINFRYMTDEFTNYEGWFIQSASVGTTPLTLTATYPKAAFQVTVIQAFVICGKTLYLPYDMCLTKDNKGMSIGAAIKPNYVLLIVSPTMHEGFADYKFQATKVPLFKFC